MKNSFVKSVTITRIFHWTTEKIEENFKPRFDSKPETFQLHFKDKQSQQEKLKNQK